MDKSEYINNEIVEEFISCCLTYRRKKLITLLTNKSIVTNMPNKLRFYKFLTYMLGCMHSSSKGKLAPKWERIKWMKKERKSLRFYDETHIFPRLTIIVEQNNDKIYLETIPF